MSKNDKKAAGQFKKVKGPSEYKLAQMGKQGPGQINPADTIGLNPHNKHRR